MKLVLLGTGGYHPTDLRQTACLAIPELGIVLDAGTGAYRLRDLVCTPELDFYLTHAHLDHVSGLTYLLDVLLDKGVRRVTVHGEQAKLDAVQTHLFNKLIFPVPPAYEFRALADTNELAGGGRLTCFPLVHPGGSLGFRLEWPGHSLAYVTDTTATADADYIEKVRGVDLLIHECNFLDGQDDFAKLTGHSCLTPVAQVARAAEARRVVLVHFNSINSDSTPVDVRSVLEIYPHMSLGFDGMVLEF